LADCLSDLGRYDRVIGYYNELIPLHQRSHKNRGIRSYSLSRYYRQLARAHSALGHTLEAMDAATSEVVLWNKTDSQRTSAMNNVQSVLNNAKDLDAYIQHLDKQTAANGTDSPMLRRMCGVALSGDGKNEMAVGQFELALQLDPLNKEARVELIKLLTRLKRPNEAIAQLMLRIDIERHNLELYTDLVNRTKGDDALSERAFTSIVESAPTEHTHHQKAAELRQGQNRWSDAIVHWQQVAKLQAFDPTGLLGLAEAQIREKKWDDARRTVQTLKSTEWPSRFRTVESQVRNFEGRIKASNK
jgi:tetratricopeptide (TPR) repeat protein